MREGLPTLEPPLAAPRAEGRREFQVAPEAGMSSQIQMGLAETMTSLRPRLVLPGHAGAMGSLACFHFLL